MYSTPFDKKNTTNTSGLKWFWYFLVGAVFLFFLSNIFKLQVINGAEYFTLSQKNASEKNVIQAKRGTIYSSDGVALAYDEELYEVSVPSNFSNDCLDPSRIESSTAILSKDELESCRARGIVFGDVRSRFERRYPFGEVFSNVIGYMGSPNTREVQEYGYPSNSRIGREGVEASYESYLRGVDGFGLEVKRFDSTHDMFMVKSPIAGDDVYLSIDSRWQNLLYGEMKKVVEKEGGLGGASVVMNANTGEVGAMVSYPGFDSNLFSEGIRQDDYLALVDDIRTPLINKAVGLQAAPGSTFKPFIASVALNLGVLHPQKLYDSVGCEYIDANIKFCEADQKVLGLVDLNTAISRSSNLYFCNVGRSLDLEYGNGVGINYLLDGLDKFGVGQITGIDLYGEASGHVSSPEYIQKTQGRVWSIGDMCNTVIGQGDVLLTTIQSSVFVASLRNSGLILKPMVVSRVQSSDGSVKFQNITESVRKLNISPENLETINNAMRNTVEDVRGSGHSVAGEKLYITMKTGSADTAETLVDGSVRVGAHSWVMGTFDLEGQTYAFSAVGQFLGRGYKTVPVVGNFISCVDTDYAEGCAKYN